MSDDLWRDDRDPDDFSEFGSLFDDSAPAAARRPSNAGTPSRFEPRRPSRPAGDLDDDRDGGRGYGRGDDLDDSPVRIVRAPREPGADRTARPATPAQAPSQPRSTAGGRPDDSQGERLSFGDSDTGSLPHWTDPPTTELPSFEPRAVAPQNEENSDVDVWSSFSSDGPVWKDDIDAVVVQPAPASPGPSTGELPKTGLHPRVSGTHDRVSGQHRRISPSPPPAEREPSRITIGTDPSGMPRRSAAPGSKKQKRQAPPPAQRGGARPAPSSRNMPIAIGVGVGLAAVFLIALRWLPRYAVLVIVAAVVGLGAVEFYERVREKGYRPSIYPGLAACVGAPVAAYFMGELALPLVIAFGFMAIAGGFIGANSVESGPLPNVSITVLGTIWIGLLGSFAVLILRFSTTLGTPYANAGTDTLFFIALGVVANDTGALLVGSAFGRTPLREWISPNKTVEGLIGGTALTIISLVVAGLILGDKGTTWHGVSDRVLLAVVISVMAPMGDLVESMFKRNLDIKDFGSIIRGHGGVLDRFDGFLFTLPAVYYLALVLKPWVG